MEKQTPRSIIQIWIKKHQELYNSNSKEDKQKVEVLTKIFEMCYPQLVEEDSFYQMNIENIIEITNNYMQEIPNKETPDECIPSLKTLLQKLIESEASFPIKAFQVLCEVNFQKNIDFHIGPLMQLFEPFTSFSFFNLIIMQFTPKQSSGGKKEKAKALTKKLDKSFPQLIKEESFYQMNIENIIEITNNYMQEIANNRISKECIPSLKFLLKKLIESEASFPIKAFQVLCEVNFNDVGFQIPHLLALLEVFQSFSFFNVIFKELSNQATLPIYAGDS